MTVHGSKIFYGDVLTALLNFVIVAAVLFFLVIKPVNHLMKRLGRTPERGPGPGVPRVPVQGARGQATRCAYCTSTLTPVTPVG